MSEERLGLAQHQRALLEILKGRPDGRATAPSEAGNRYLDLVRKSPGLRMQRTITATWRRYDVERTAPLTTRALTHLERLDEELARLARDPNTPTAVDALGLHFLAGLTGDPDPLIAAVAGTERGLLLVAHGDRSRHEVVWDRDPAPVLNGLLAGGQPRDATAGRFRVIVSADLPGLISVERAVSVNG